MAVLDFLLLLALLLSSALSLSSVPVLSTLSGRAAVALEAASAGAAVEVAAVTSSVVASSSAPFPFLRCSRLEWDNALSVRVTSRSFFVSFSDLPSSFASLAFFEASSPPKRGLEVTADGLASLFSTRDVDQGTDSCRFGCIAAIVVEAEEEDDAVPCRRVA